MSDILQELTPKQLKLCDEIADEYIRDLSKPKKPLMPAIKRWLSIAYGLYNKQVPDRIEIVASPFSACALATELTGVKQTFTDYCGIGSAGWVSFYDYFHRIGVLKNDEFEQIEALRDFIRCAWDTILLDELAIIIEQPITMCLDDAGNLHAAGKPCIQWRDGNKDFAWHGIWVPEKIVMAPRSYTKGEYLAITNTEERRSLSEAAGWDWVAKLLGAEMVNTWIDLETGLKYDLLSCMDGPKLLSKQSPKLKNGSQPLYMEPVHEDLKTAMAARKWQATILTPEECERDPELKYGIES
jgi:hypothetical protein